jgi:ubiquinone/menaquinone biosynthesis C-methylase UbiE
MKTTSYIIQGGIEGFDRLKVLARVMHPLTCALFDRVGILPGMRCLDLGCGSGDVSFELARRVGADGRVVGVDLDEVKLALAAGQADADQLHQVEFRQADVTKLPGRPEYDVIYARFVLTHLTDPAATLGDLSKLLRPGGALVAEDIDFSSCFLYPSSPSFERFRELYIRAGQRRGADPLIGPRLYSLLSAAGLSQVRVDIAQPVDAGGDVKLLAPLTMKAIAPAVMEDGSASQGEVESVIGELEAMVHESTSILGLPRVFQVWGRAGSLARAATSLSE